MSFEFTDKEHSLTWIAANASAAQMTYIIISWSFFTTRASQPWNKEACYISLWQPHLDTQKKSPKALNKAEKYNKKKGFFFRSHVYFLLITFTPDRILIPKRKLNDCQQKLIPRLILGLSYLRIKVHWTGQTASTIAESCFATAKWHAVVLSLFEPDSILPVCVVMDPTTAQLKNTQVKSYCVYQSLNWTTQKF